MTTGNRHETKRSILIVDDVEMNRSIVKRIFEGIYNVHEAENGEVALNVLRENSIDLVLLDVQMPVKNGLETLKEMKEDSRLSSIPVVMITTEVGRAEKEAFKLGADDFISQPYDPYIMRKRVENLVERYDLIQMRGALLEQRRYRNLFDIMQIAYWEWTVSGGYYRSEKYGDYAISEMEDDKIWDPEEPFKYVYPDDVQLMKDFMQQYDNDQVKKSAIVRCLMKDGTYRWTEMFSIAETAPDGKLLRLVTIMRNVDREWLDQKKELELALVKANEASQAKSDFLSRVSHDMRTPLNVILSIAHLVPEEKPSNEVMLSYFNSIDEEGSFLLRLINDVLDMQKMESGVIELKPEPVSFESIMNPVIEQAKHLASEKQIDFQVQTIHFKKLGKALMDPLRIQQLLTNLLANAIKYTPKHGRVDLIFENISFENNIARDRIIIRDTGCGMNQKFMNKMYEPFSQENGGSTSTTRGTGLGLSIVKRIVDIMGGTIDCKSEVGKGTEFSLILDTPILANEIELQKEATPVVEHNDYALIGRRILLCEDHPMNAKIAAKLLSRKGLIITTAQNGAIGLEKFQQSSVGYYDAILMDIRMPVMDGLEATREIRALDREDATKVPIIAMTANAYREDIDNCMNAGMNEHLAKPIDPPSLWKALNTYIDFTKSIQKMKVVIVDDVETNRVVIAESIKEAFEPILVSSAQEALVALETYPDVAAVITDIIMPGMDGQQLIRTIRSNHGYDHIGILANTEYGQLAKEEEILKDGADDFIYKPTTPSVLMTRLTNILVNH